MLTKAAFILVFTMAISVVAISTSISQSPIIHDSPAKQEDGKTADSKKNSETIDQDSTSPMTIVNPIPTPPLQEIGDKECYHYNNKKNTSWWNFSLTDALLVIFTCGLVIIGWLQVHILRGNLKATQIAADAARDSAKVAETALHVAERAYLRIDGFDLVNFSIGGYINVRYEIHNVGHTPAQIMESLTIVDIVEKDSFKTPIYEIEKGISGPKQAFIQPDEKASMIGISKNIVTSEEFKNVTTNDKLIFVWGKITFRDVFGKIWVNGFGTVFSQVFGPTVMDGYNYTKENEQDKEQA